MTITPFTVSANNSIFSDVGAADKGVYTCNLHHHYCQIHQSIQIQLNVTKSGEELTEENQPDHLTSQLSVGRAKMYQHVLGAKLLHVAACNSVKKTVGNSEGTELGQKN